MPITFKNTATAAIAAFSIAAGAAAPAHAFGSNERKFFQGVAAAVIIGTILNQNKRSRPAAPAARMVVIRDEMRHAATNKAIGETSITAPNHRTMPR